MTLRSESTRSSGGDAEAARLAHKRALDRKAQNAKRERTRLHIESLEERLAASEERVKTLAAENEQLQTENSRLRRDTTFTPSNTSGLALYPNESGPTDGQSVSRRF